MIIRLLIAGLLLQGSSYAQEHVSGTWNLQKKEPIAGPQYSNALPKQLSIQQQADSLIIETVNVGADGQDTKGRQAIALDGKQQTINSAKTNRKYVKSLQKTADQKGLVLTTVFYVPDNPTEVDFTRVETWTVSPDGKQLSIHKKSIETRSETWEVKGTYIKQ